MIPEMKDQLYDIYDLWDYPWYYNKVYLSVVIILFLFFSIGAFSLYKKIKGRKRNKKLSFKESIFNQLELIGLQDIKSGYFDLTACLKLYIEKRYGVPVQKETDLEIQNVIVRLIDEKYVSQVQAIFKRAFDAKFGASTFQGSELKDDVSFVKQFIKETIEQQNTKGA